MPLINGQKMACEPCIRGHRSTKCTHANERLMVPVRKPGRPLSSCPHPASRPCTCGAVTAAIPRKQKCGCGPPGTSETTAKPEAEDESDTATTSPGESKSGSATFRVQKPASRRPSIRKPSTDPAALEKMDPAQLNIMPAYNGSNPASNGNDKSPAETMNGMSSYGGMGMAGAENTYGAHPMMYPMFPQPMPSPMIHSAPMTPSSNGHYSTPSNEYKASSVTPGQKSCCGGGKAASEEDDKSPTASTAASGANNNAEKNTKGCCSSKKNGSSNTTTPLPNGTTPMQTTHQHHPAMMMPPFQMPIPMPNGMYSFYPHPTVFTYPPQYGTFMQPLQPDQWRQMMAAFSFGQAAPQQPTFDMSGVAPTPVPYSTTPEMQNKNSGTSHHCDCGDSCNCVGCAAHPYNEATRDYVLSAWNSMAEEQTNGNRHSTNGHHQETSASHTPSETPAATTAPGGGTGAGSEPHTPSDATSALGEEQTLSANDFFFVSYPFNSCAGDTASCPCGDACECIGCVIHNNPGPEEVSQTS